MCKVFLKLLLIPDCYYKEIAIDFITDLLVFKGCRYLQVICDCLSKEIVFEPITSIDAEACVE